MSASAILPVYLVPPPAPQLAEDADLVARALDGDARAETMLFQRHARHVLAVVARMVGRNDAEDIVQDTFVIVLERLAQLRDPAAFRAWLVRTAVREVYRRTRRRRLLARLGFGDHADEIELEPAAQLTPEQRAQVGELARLLGELSLHDRICWMLRHVEGYRLEEVAEAAGCSLATAKRRIAAADRVIRDRIALEDAP